MSDEQRPAPQGKPQNAGADVDAPMAQAGATPGQAAGPASQAAQPEGESDPVAGSAELEAHCAELEAHCAELEARCAALQDQHLRAVAEGENIRRRAQEEVAKAHKYGIEAFAESLLPVRDSLELALASEVPSIASMKEGVEATLRQLASVFEKNKLLVIDPAGQRFDPNLHQAISMVPGDSTDPPVPANHVVSVLQKGYLINDRVLRPALVMVAQG